MRRIRAIGRTLEVTATVVLLASVIGLGALIVVGYPLVASSIDTYLVVPSFVVILGAATYRNVYEPVRDRRRSSV